MPANVFSVRWTGKVTPLYTETYTFITSTDDGVRLWVNNQLLVNQWHDQGTTSYQGTIALTAGAAVDIRMEFYDNEWGATAQLEWQSASQPRQIIPRDRLSTPAAAAAALAAAPNYTAARLLVSPATAPTDPGAGASAAAAAATPTSRTFHRPSARPSKPSSTSHTVTTGPESGLHAEYFSGENFNAFVTARTDDSIAFYWPEGAAPLPGVAGDRFSVRWTGRIRPMFSEDYSFFMVTDEGVRLWVNGELLVDRWNPSAQTDGETPGVPIFLRAGQFYNLQVEFQNVIHDGWVELKWESDSQPREIVPGARLSQPTESAPPAP